MNWFEVVEVLTACNVSYLSLKRSVVWDVDASAWTEISKDIDVARMEKNSTSDMVKEDIGIGGRKRSD